jgi:hypothetical protein
VQIVDVWESRADADAFERDRLMPVFAAAGIIERITSGPRPVVAEAFEFELSRLTRWGYPGRDQRASVSVLASWLVRWTSSKSRG